MPGFWGCIRFHPLPRLEFLIFSGSRLTAIKNPGIVLDARGRMRQPEGHGTRGDSATAAEVIAAIESLSAEEDYRLKKYARYRIRGLGRAAMGRTYSSLLAQAVASTLQGAESKTKGRKWDKNRVPFVHHLLGVMRSVSTHWKETYERRGMEAEELDCEAARVDEYGNLLRPTEQSIDPTADPFRSCAASELLDMLDKHFAGDQDALLVIKALKRGMSLPEMVTESGLTEKKIRAAKQRVRYFMEGHL
jgi:hypothetical protein